MNLSHPDYFLSFFIFFGGIIIIIIIIIITLHFFVYLFIFFYFHFMVGRSVGRSERSNLQFVMFFFNCNYYEVKCSGQE